MPAIIIRQRKAWRRKDGVFLYFEVTLTSILFILPRALSLFLGQRGGHRQPQR
jgi:hypothetical protein